MRGSLEEVEVMLKERGKEIQTGDRKGHRTGPTVVREWVVRLEHQGSLPRGGVEGK